MTKIRTSEIPSHAKHLYIQLYCDKKGGKTNENLHNAAQSWLSLSLTKKQHFYDTISTKSAIKKAQRIIQTKPYLRLKLPSNGRKRKRNSTEGKECQNNGDSDLEHATNDDLITSVHETISMDCDYSSNSFVEENNEVARGNILQETNALETENNTHQEETRETELELTQNGAQMSDVQKNQETYMNVIDDEETDTAEEDFNENPEDIPILVEPVLPITKTGRELFDLLKTRNGTNKTYESLTNPEKKVYGQAVCNLKKDYVKKYKEYLESLSPKQLFDYYMKLFQ